MTININNSLIDEFRNKVNENKFFREKFRNVNGRNHWNIICSAMDWISVAADGLPEINLKTPKGFGYNHLETLNLMQYIITVDILAESIIQLFRVIDGSKPYPLSEDHEIFEQSKLSDDKYFKHLRAVFSTHPVNLNSVDGVKKEDDERFFASWVAKNGVGNDDFYVLLYSSDPAKDQVNPLGINIEDINLYAEKRYNLLRTLMDKVDQINIEHIQSCRKKIIPIANDPIEQIEILLEENEKRFGKDYGYANGLHYLYSLLKVDTSPIVNDSEKAVINEYKDFLRSLIPQIKDGLQDMLITSNWKAPYKYEYEFEKIYTYFRDGVHPIGKQYFNALIKKGPLPNVLATCEDLGLKQLVMDAYLHKESTKLDRPLSFKEFLGS
ncbi:hypothetical protein ABHN11_05110 [Brevibacillus centrosporus]|uniref:hypothetical protein n=1 Tax=Brevibacillus centrosporus TaxID=54910 RepID=UPI003D1BCFAB